MYIHICAPPRSHRDCTASSRVEGRFSIFSWRLLGLLYFIWVILSVYVLDLESPHFLSPSPLGLSVFAETSYIGGIAHTVFGRILVASSVGNRIERGRRHDFFVCEALLDICCRETLFVYAGRSISPDTHSHIETDKAPQARPPHVPPPPPPTFLMRLESRRESVGLNI